MNKQASEEWIQKAWHNLSGAKIFYDANHYTDVTAIELHYSVEKILKSFLAYGNKKIPKTHNLVEIHSLITEYIQFTEDEIDLLEIISEYHIEESYPVFNRELPAKEEIKEILDFANKLFNKVCVQFSINKSELL